MELHLKMPREFMNIVLLNEFRRHPLNKIIAYKDIKSAA
jgi:hypothetical protein